MISEAALKSGVPDILFAIMLPIVAVVNYVFSRQKVAKKIYMSLFR